MPPHPNSQYPTSFCDLSVFLSPFSAENLRSAKLNLCGLMMKLHVDWKIIFELGHSYILSKFRTHISKIPS